MKPGFLSVFLGIIVTVLIGTTYVSVQQQGRQLANDPQIQLAEDLAAQIKSGRPIAPTTETVDISTSLAPYTIIFDTNGKEVAGTARLDGKLPAIPAGLFDQTRADGEYRVTWQPRPVIRSALVIVSAGTHGFIAAGRSLRETENRISDLGSFIFIAWAILMLILIGGWAIFKRRPLH